jgi:hypothetical protein
VTPFARFFALVSLLCANVRAAEHDWPASPRAEGAEERISLAVSTRAGLVEAPFVTSAFPEVSGFGMVLTGSAAVQFSSIGWLRLKLPVSVVRLDFPAGAQVSEAALGNLELGLEHSLELRPSTRVGFLAGVLAPSAEHGSRTSLLGNRALALASALSAGKDSASLTPGVIGLRLAGSVEHSHHPFAFRASLDVPLLVRISDASLPEHTETHAIGVLPSLNLGAAWWITSSFGVSLGAGLITEPWRVQEPTLERDRNRRVQPVVEPGLHLRLGEYVTLGLNAIIPVAGALGGDAFGIGLHGRLGF